MVPTGGVLLDSGGVLIRPVGGRWNPRFDFEPIVLEVAPHLTGADFAGAIAAGEAFFAAAAADASRDDYHRAVLEAIDVTGTATLLEKLRRPLDPTTVVEPYPEVIEVLTKLRDQGFKMGCVTDNSPDIEHLHEGLGIRHFFEVYAISPVLGCTKPDPRMYHHASNALGLRPEECLFVDDVPQLVAAAIDLGFRGVVVERPGPSPATRVPTVSDLTGILDLLGSHL